MNTISKEEAYACMDVCREFGLKEVECQKIEKIGDKVSHDRFHLAYIENLGTSFKYSLCVDIQHLILDKYVICVEYAIRSPWNSEEKSFKCVSYKFEPRSAQSLQELLSNTSIKENVFNMFNLINAF